MEDAPKGPRLTKNNFRWLVAAHKVAQRPTTDPPPAPPDLSDEAAAMWRAIASELVLVDTHEIAILTLAMEAFDRYREAAEILATEGLTIVSPSGLKKKHPAHGIAMDYLTEVRRCLSHLGSHS